MAAYPQYYNPYQPNVPAPMDRLQQLQQPYQMPQMVPQIPQTQPSNGILWVQGEAAAKAYLVAPGTSVLLMDSDQSAFYIKTVDNAGMPLPLRVFKYEEVGQNVPQAQKPAEMESPVKYVTREEYDDLKGKYEDILKRLDAMPAETPKRPARKAVDNE